MSDVSAGIATNMWHPQAKIIQRFLGTNRSVPWYHIIHRFRNDCGQFDCKLFAVITGAGELLSTLSPLVVAYKVSSVADSAYSLFYVYDSCRGLGSLPSFAQPLHSCTATRRCMIFSFFANSHCSLLGTLLPLRQAASREHA